MPYPDNHILKVTFLDSNSGPTLQIWGPSRFRVQLVFRNYSSLPHCWVLTLLHTVFPLLNQQPPFQPSTLHNTWLCDKIT